jgi:GTP-binding protein HflX
LFGFSQLGPSTLTAADAIIVSVKDMHETVAGPERAFLIGVRDGRVKELEAESLLRELRCLADTLGVATVGSMTIVLRERNPALLAGSGKTDEIIAAAKLAGADSIIFDRPLSPIQQRNWEILSDLTVYDRSELIIKIFASRAHTREASLQVELARLQYALPRLSHSYEDLHRQKGGRYGTKGSGEQKLELDRREISRRIADIKEDLKHVRQNRLTQRKQRDRMELPRAAIIGYTNAGKSSLLNALASTTVLAEDKLFATLDPTTRRLNTANGPVLITDTVGFIRNLPHGLIEAFKATLEEASEADLLVHVLDAADPECETQFSTTRTVLSEIGAGSARSLVVYNKIDLLPDREVLRFMGRVHDDPLFISARTGEGLQALRDAIGKALAGDLIELDLLVPPEDYAAVAMVYREAVVLSEDHVATGTRLHCRVPERLVARLKPYSLSSLT